MGAPIKVIKPSHDDSHQASPGYVIAFLPFTYRDTFNKKDNFKNVSVTQKSLQINNPIVVVNDAVHINIHSSKAQAMDVAEIHLLSGDKNYSAAVAPGDHALIWLFNNQEDFRAMSGRILRRDSKLNTENSGLKFIGRVNSVRQVLQVQPSDGKKTYRHIVTLAGFSELQTQIYFNELLSPVTQTQDQASEAISFFAQIAKQYLDVFKSVNNKTGRIPTEDLISFFLDVFVGTGPKDVANSIDSNLRQTPNASFLIPAELAKYLGLSFGQKAERSLGFQYSDILHRVFGLQRYSDSMFPISSSGGRSSYFRCGPLKGGTLIQPANFNNITLWSLLTQFMNPSLNEMYTTLKYIPSKGGIYPTIILRQLPFSTKYILKKYDSSQVTLFSNLPRWTLSPKYPIFNYNLGTSDAERFNFFQVYTNSISNASNDPQQPMRVQTVMGNVSIDLADIIRSGPRIHSTFSDTEAPVQKDGKTQPSPINEWTDIITDCFVNGHLKMNGTITVAGIQDPICVGDNFQFDNKLFHIEGVEHKYTVDPVRGIKNFTTTLVLTHGYYVANGELYYMSSQPQNRESQTDKDLPGYSDEERYIGDVPIFSSASSPQTENKESGANLTARQRLLNAYKKKMGAE